MVPDVPKRVHLLVGDEHTWVHPAQGGADRPDRLDDLPLVVEPGRWVAWQGRTYLLEREGRYCFTDGRLMRNVLVFEADYVGFFAGLAQIHVKGLRHRPLSVEQRIEVARCGRLSLMCGGIASVALHLLREMGHRARRVVALSQDRRRSHVAIEYFTPDRRRWALVDIHNHALLEAGGRLLGVGDLLAHRGRGEAFEVRRLSGLGGLDYFSWEPDGRGESGLDSELLVYADDVAKAFYAARARAWGIYAEDGLAWFPEERAAGIMQASERYRCIPRDAWLERFYGGVT